MNKLIEEHNSDKKIPIKYIFLLYTICLISGAIFYKIIQNFMKLETKKDYLNNEIITILTFLIMFSIFIFLIKKKLDVNKIVKINTIYISFFLILNFAAFFYLYKMGFQCSIFLHNYEAFNLCHEKVKIYYSLFPFYYNVSVIFIISFISIFLLFLRNKSITTDCLQLSTLNFFLWLLFITEIPLILKYIFKI